jgi:AI-2 transport protein TqsA
VIMLSVGTDAAVLWAVIAFMFAFVPFGFILSAIPPFILTLLEFGVSRALIMFGLFFVVNFIGDNVVKPKLMGGGLGLSPLVIVLALLGWGVVLGPMGALLAIPLTLTVKELYPILMGDMPAVQPAVAVVAQGGLADARPTPVGVRADDPSRWSHHDNP